MIRIFGRLNHNIPVHAIMLKAGQLQATILTLGSILQDVRLASVPYGLTIGSDRLADYEGGLRHHGPLVGPVANRIAQARAGLNGQIYAFDANQEGRHCLHSGQAGIQFKIWDITDHGPDHATLLLELPDGAGGFPGRRQIKAHWQIMPPATLRVSITTKTDADSWVNITNHSYWNLDGTPQWAGHRLKIAAPEYLPVDGDLVPTGEIALVDDTPYDFRAWRDATPQHPPLDTNFCVSRRSVPLRDVLWLRGKSGVSMTLATTEPGVQVYDNRKPALQGRMAYEGLAIEPQGWPDAPNRPGFPSVVLQAGGVRVQQNEWRFEPA